MKRVPAEPDRVRVRTGELVRVEVTADRDGFVTVFNIGPTGNLNLLYPDHLPGPGAPPNVRANQPLFVTEVEFTLPAGRERVVAVWSAGPLPLTEQELRGLADEKGRAYHATRDMKRVKDAVRRADPGTRRVAVLELEHNAT